MLGFKQSLRKNSFNFQHFETSNSDGVNWVERGAVTPVKNQGSCGSCWSFSTTGSVEGALEIKTGKLVSLSEQQLVECSTANLGCNGGLPDRAFGYVEEKGLCAESDYPYTSGDGSVGTCRDSACTPVAKISNYQDVKKYSQSALMAAVAVQPVSIAIEADKKGFQFYESGVFSGECGTALDHAVLLVGYGHDEETGLNYWKVKNSWSSSWGDEGYIRIERKSGFVIFGTCGILKFPSYPVA